MKRIIFIILALICSIPMINARTIQGIVLSSNDSTAVAGANCRLLADGKLIAGATANNEGKFSLETELKSALNLEISMTGFASTDVIIETGSKNLNVGTIYLDESVTLNEVTVTGNSAINSKGRTIVYPSTSDVKASATTIGKLDVYVRCKRHTLSVVGLLGSQSGISRPIYQEQREYGGAVGKLYCRLRLDFPHCAPES